MALPEFVPRQSYYLEQVVDLPPLVSCAAFDGHVDQAGRLGVVSVRSGPAELVLDPHVTRPEGPPQALAPYRTMAGSLRAGVRKMTVELELNPYSAHCTQLGLRPLRWGLTAWPAESLLSGGAQLLAVIAAQLVGQVRREIQDSLSVVEPAVQWSD